MQINVEFRKEERRWLPVLRCCNWPWSFGSRSSKKTRIFEKKLRILGLLLQCLEVFDVCLMKQRLVNDGSNTPKKDRCKWNWSVAPKEDKSFTDFWLGTISALLQESLIEEIKKFLVYTLWYCFQHIDVKDIRTNCSEMCLSDSKSEFFCDLGVPRILLIGGKCFKTNYFFKLKLVRIVSIIGMGIIKVYKC